MRILAFTCWLFLLPFLTLAQGKKAIVLYSAKQDYLIGKIEETLTALVNPVTNEPLFKTVTNLNQISRNIASESALRESVDYYSSRLVDISSEAKKTNAIFANILLENDYFLIANIDLVSDAIEYQFYLYRVEKGAENTPQNHNLFPAINPLFPVKKENVLINLDDNKKFFELESAVKRLFPETTYRPDAKININKNLEVSNGNYYCSISDTIKLLSTFSSDKDTKREDLRFSWRQIDIKADYIVEGSPTASLVEKNDFAEAFFNKEGLYKFGLKVYDGVGSSNEDTICIVVIRPPKIQATKKQIRLVGYEQMFSNRLTAKDNKFMLLSTKKEGYSLSFRKLFLDINDTLKLLNYYNRLRMNYDQKMYEHIHGISSGRGGTYYPPAPEPLPNLEAFLRNPFNYNIKTQTKAFDEGILISIPFDYVNLNNAELEFFLQNHGVKSNKQNVRISNIAFSPYSFRICYKPSGSAIVKIDTLLNDSLQLSFRAFEFQLSGRLLNMVSQSNPWDKDLIKAHMEVAIGYTYIPKVAFSLDTLRTFNSKISMSASFYFDQIAFNRVYIAPFTQYQINFIPINRIYNIPPKQVQVGGIGGGRTETITTETETKWFSQQEYQLGIELGQSERFPLNLLLFYGGILKSKNGNKTLKFTENSTRFGFGVRYKFLRSVGGLSRSLNN